MGGSSGEGIRRYCRLMLGDRETAEDVVQSTFFSAYKEGDDLKNTRSFGRGELRLVAKLADLAHTKIFELSNAATIDDCLRMSGDDSSAHDFALREMLKAHWLRRWWSSYETRTDRARGQWRPRL